MPLTWTIPGPTRTDQLVAHASKATPKAWSSLAAPELAAIAATLRSGADDPITDWIRSCYITYAEGVWLDAHGRMLVRPRAAGESDELYRIRLRLVDDAVTPAAVLAAANAVLAAAGLANAAMVELPRDAAYTGTSTASIRSYLSRGYRLMSTGHPTVILICPPGTSAAVVASVAAAVGLVKAGGVSTIVEPY